ncbi:Serine O-succinyltransferase [Teratosphaeriaceae sp. CCFEE 6253]|nr:Serine O-succinyltransferase [Teratosphaeriaceae sp. CCFEE 6253]
MASLTSKPAMSILRGLPRAARCSVRTRAPFCAPEWSVRSIHQVSKHSAQAAAIHATEPALPDVPLSSNPQLAFPCLDNVEARTQKLSKRSMSGPEPSYTTGEHETFRSHEPILLDWGGVLPRFDIAYETWGTLNADQSNAILLHTGLSASSHAHSTPANPKPGWWEKFIGPGAPLDTDKYFVICTNVLGGCYGSTGPASVDPTSQQPYATSFPILTMQDMVRAQFRLLDDLKISKLYASVGCSMGGMQSLSVGVLDPDRVGRIVSVSGCARSHPYSIAMRHTQRQVLMSDPNWAGTRGNYYSHIPPHQGMKLARQIATITYRSGPEWEKRFGRQRADSSRPPALCPDFLIETYLDHAGEKWCLEYDANSLLYVSKAMDLFDLGKQLQDATTERRRENAGKLQGTMSQQVPQDSCSLVLPDEPYQETESSQEIMAFETPKAVDSDSASDDLVKGMAPLRDTPTLVVGVASDILFPAFQQREIAETLRKVGNRLVTHVEFGEDRSLFGHDTFLLDLEGRWLRIIPLSMSLPPQPQASESSVLAERTVYRIKYGNEQPFAVNRRLWQAIQTSVVNLCTRLWPGELSRDTIRNAVLTRTYRRHLLSAHTLDDLPPWATDNTQMRVVWLAPRRIEQMRIRLRGTLCVENETLFTTLMMRPKFAARNHLMDWAEVLNNLIRSGLVEGHLVPVQEPGHEVIGP